MNSVLHSFVGNKNISEQELLFVHKSEHSLTLIKVCDALLRSMYDLNVSDRIRNVLIRGRYVLKEDAVTRI